MLKTVYAPPLNRHVKLGRLRPEPPARPALRFESFLGDVALPAPPASVDYSPKGQPALANVYGNDQLGDCVVAGGYHLLALTTGNATGTPFVATPQQIVADYSAIGGYVPGDPSTDNGCDEVTALNYWVKHGFANGDKLAGWLAVDATNPTLLRQAMWLFENLFFGIELPGPWLNPFPQGDGFTWDVAGDPDPNNGHCVVSTGFRSPGVTLDTWGLAGTLTDRAAAAYASPRGNGEAYVLLFPDMIAKGKELAPNGFAWDKLVSYFDAIGGRLPIPVGPTPTPTPPAPTPPTPAPFIPASALVIDPPRRHVSMPPGMTAVPTGGPLITFDPVKNAVAVIHGWDAAVHPGPAHASFLSGVDVLMNTIVALFTWYQTHKAAVDDLIAIVAPILDHVHPPKLASQLKAGGPAPHDCPGTVSDPGAKPAG